MLKMTPKSLCKQMCKAITARGQFSKSVNESSSQTKLVAVTADEKPLFLLQIAVILNVTQNTAGMLIVPHTLIHIRFL